MLWHFFPYHGSARVLASRPLKMNQATSEIGHILFEFEFELKIHGDEQFLELFLFLAVQHLKAS